MSRARTLRLDKRCLQWRYRFFKVLTILFFSFLRIGRLAGRSKEEILYQGRRSTDRTQWPTCPVKTDLVQFIEYCFEFRDSFFHFFARYSSLSTKILNPGVSTHFETRSYNGRWYHIAYFLLLAFKKFLEIFLSHISPPFINFFLREPLTSCCFHQESFVTEKWVSNFCKECAVPCLPKPWWHFPSYLSSCWCFLSLVVFLQ